MRIKVWFTPATLIGLKAVILKKWGKFYKVLYRDLDGKCRITYEIGKTNIVDRSALDNYLKTNKQQII